MNAICSYADLDPKINGTYVGGMNIYASFALCYSKTQLEAFWISKYIYFHPNFSIFQLFNSTTGELFKKIISYHSFFLKTFLPKLFAIFVSYIE